MSEKLMVASVYMFGQLAGKLIRRQAGFSFEYDKAYLQNQGVALSHSLPLQYQTFTSDELFPFFSGLVSEGWLLDLQSKIQHIDKHDAFNLLVKNGRDLAGAVTIELSNLS